MTVKKIHIIGGPGSGKTYINIAYTSENTAGGNV